MLYTQVTKANGSGGIESHNSKMCCLVGLVSLSLRLLKEWFGVVLVRARARSLFGISYLYPALKLCLFMVPSIYNCFPKFTSTVCILAASPALAPASSKSGTIVFSGSLVEI
jgi:hypothetical protein